MHIRSPGSLTTMGRRRRILVALGLAILTIGLAVGVALAAGSSSGLTASARRAPEPGSEANRRSAIADARKRLRSFDPPPGSHRVRALPKFLHLSGPALRPGSPRYLDVHASWVSSESVGSVRSFLETHTPPGSRHSLTSSAGDRGGIYRWDYGYSWPELPNVADDRELLAGVVARPGGGSAIRADAQATYVEPKPKGEQIPKVAKYLEAEEVFGKTARIVGTSSEAKIDATAKLIDGLSILQRNGPEECGPGSEQTVTLKGIFRISPGGRVVAETEQTLPAGFCDYIGVTVDGKKGRLLRDENGELTDALQNLLARKYKTPLLDGIEGF
jgi:hypothetical protein